jgi:hypothetical protein
MSPVYLLASPPGQPFRQSEATFPSPHIPAPPPPCARVCLAHTLPIWNVTLYVTLCFTLFIDPFVFQCPAERRSMTSGGSRAARSRPVIGAAVASDRLWAHTPHLHSGPHAAPALASLSLCLTSCCALPFSRAQVQNGRRLCSLLATCPQVGAYRRLLCDPRRPRCLPGPPAPAHPPLAAHWDITITGRRRRRQSARVSQEWRLLGARREKSCAVHRVGHLRLCDRAGWSTRIQPRQRRRQSIAALVPLYRV